MRVVARQHRVYAPRGWVNQGDGGHVRAQRGGEHPRHQGDRVPGRDQRHLAGQVGGVKVDPGGDARASGMLAQQCRRALVVLDPGLTGQHLDPYPLAPGQGVSGRKDDDHLVKP